MVYAKPRIIDSLCAVKLVQGNEKGSTHVDGPQPFPYGETVNAYEADE